MPVISIHSIRPALFSADSSRVYRVSKDARGTDREGSHYRSVAIDTTSKEVRGKRAGAGEERKA